MYVWCLAAGELSDPSVYKAQFFLYVGIMGVKMRIFRKTSLSCWQSNALYQKAAHVACQVVKRI